MHVLQRKYSQHNDIKNVAEKLHRSALKETPHTFFPWTYSLSWCIFLCVDLRHDPPDIIYLSAVHLFIGPMVYKKPRYLDYFKDSHFGKDKHCALFYSMSKHVKHLSCALLNIFISGRRWRKTFLSFSLDVRNFYEVAPIFNMKTQLNGQCHAHEV